jgi:hypothetical protein
VKPAGIFKKSMGAKHQVGIGLSHRPARAGIFKQSMGARNRVTIGLSYRPAILHRLAEYYFVHAWSIKLVTSQIIVTKNEFKDQFLICFRKKKTTA